MPGRKIRKKKPEGDKKPGWLTRLFGKKEKPAKPPAVLIK